MFGQSGGRGRGVGGGGSFVSEEREEEEDGVADGSRACEEEQIDESKACEEEHIDGSIPEEEGLTVRSKGSSHSIIFSNTVSSNIIISAANKQTIHNMSLFHFLDNAQ